MYIVVELIGGEDMYRPACRRCFVKPLTNKDNKENHLIESNHQKTVKKEKIPAEKCHTITTDYTKEIK